MKAVKLFCTTITSAVVFLTGTALPVMVEAGPLHRLAANFDFFGPGEEAFTSIDADNPDPLNGGLAIYNQSVSVPLGHNVLFISLSTTGDTHEGAASCFTAKVDGAFANPGGQGAARCADAGATPVPGWVTLQKMTVPTRGSDNCDDGVGGAGDCHDNNINYTWCAPTKRGKHDVEIRMATDIQGENVFIEQAHFNVDSATLPKGKACEDPTVAGPGPFPPGAPPSH